jgi:hypothetical protein
MTRIRIWLVEPPEGKKEAAVMPAMTPADERKPETVMAPGDATPDDDRAPYSA